MSDDKPVFINQTPDYQEAVKKASELAHYQAPFAAAAQELGLSGELQQAKNTLETMKPRAQQLEMKEAILAQQKGVIDAQGARTAKDLSTTGEIALIATGFTTGALLAPVKPKGWNLLKPIAKIVAVVGAAALGWAGITHKVMSGTREAQKATDKDMILNQMNENQMTFQATAIQNNFLDAMATKMLEQQKMLSGEGAQMKLVSTAPEVSVPAQSSMTEKYATPPADSKAAEMAAQKISLSVTAQAR